MTPLKDINQSELGEYAIRNLNDALILHDEIAAFWPCLSFAKVEGSRIEYFIHKLDAPIGIKVHKDYKGDWHVYSTEQYNRLDYNSMEHIRKIKDMQPPNNFRVLSRKNLDKWVQYLLSLDVLFKADNDRRNKEVNEFLEEAAKQGVNIDSFDNQRGYKECDLASYSFRIEPSGYIEERIQLKGRQTLALFLQIAAQKNLVS